MCRLACVLAGASARRLVVGVGVVVAIRAVLPIRVAGLVAIRIHRELRPVFRQFASRNRQIIG